MKILHCIPSLDVGGAERQLSILALAQSRIGNEVHVAYVRDGPVLRYLVDSQVRLHRVPAAGNYDFRLLYRLHVLIRDIEPDIVQSWLPQMDILAGIICIFQNIPWIISERCSQLAYKTRITDRVLRPLIGKRASAVIANSKGGREVWLPVMPLHTPMVVVRNAVSVKELRDAPVHVFGALDLPDRTPLVVFVGRFAPQKNIEVLLLAAQRIVERSSATVLMCGDGPLYSNIIERLRILKLEKRIRVLGYRSDIAEILKLSQVFLSPSLFEGQPNAVLEAMMCGCPLVVSDIPAHREFLDDSLAALVPPSNANQFADEVISALTGSTLTMARSEAAASLAREWAPDKVAADYQKVYETVLGRSANRSGMA